MEMIIELEVLRDQNTCIACVRYQFTNKSLCHEGRNFVASRITSLHLIVLSNLVYSYDFLHLNIVICNGNRTCQAYYFHAQINLSIIDMTTKTKKMKRKWDRPNKILARCTLLSNLLICHGFVFIIVGVYICIGLIRSHCQQS